MGTKFLNGLDLANQQVKNLADGTAATDAVTLQQLQSYVRGLDWKASVRAASTANVTVASPGASIDGVTLVAGDRVLLKNQTTASENGIYTWSASGSALIRATDASAGTLTAGAAVLTTEGTTNADTAWVLSTDDPITVGTTSLAFSQFGGGITYSAGNGLQLSGTAFSVKLPASSGLVADGTGLYVDTTLVARKFSQTIGNGSLTSIAVTHNLGTKDVQVTLRDASSDAMVGTDWTATSTNVVTLTFATAPTTNQYRVTVIG